MTKWKLVPTTPTWEMQVRARDAMIDATGNEDLSTDEVAVGLVAAVSASPAPPDVVAVLEGIKRDLQQPAEFYAKYGPTWTGKDGHEYEDTSTHLDFAAEIESKVVALIAQLKGEAK